MTDWHKGKGRERNPQEGGWGGGEPQRERQGVRVRGAVARIGNNLTSWGPSVAWMACEMRDKGGEMQGQGGEEPASSAPDPSPPPSSTEDTAPAPQPAPAPAPAPPPPTQGAQSQSQPTQSQQQLQAPPAQGAAQAQASQPQQQNSSSSGSGAASSTASALWTQFPPASQLFQQVGEDVTIAVGV
jgi:hypothetical protein